RWGSAVPEQCRTVGCATLEIVEQNGQTIAHIKRAPDAPSTDVELIYAATADAAHLPALYASLPAGVNEVGSIVDARYKGAKVELVDVSPFPFNCKGCVVAGLPIAP